MVVLKRWWDLIQETVESFAADGGPNMGAALSYYTLFSIAPLVYVVILVAGLIFGEDAARGEIFAQLRGLMGDQGASAVQSLVVAVREPATGVVGTIVGIAVLLVGATTVFAQLQLNLDRIWRVPTPKKVSSLWALLRARVLSFGMILGLGFLLIVSLIASAALAALGKWWAPLLGSGEVLAQVLNLALSFGLFTAAFALIYKYIPRARIEWHDVWIGAVVTAVLFTVGEFTLGIYLGKSAIASGFGAAGSLVVVLVWVYYSAQIFLLGAEYTWVYANEFGSRKAESAAQPSAAPGTAARISARTPARSIPAVVIPVGSTSAPAVSAGLAFAFGCVVTAVVAFSTIVAKRTAPRGSFRLRAR